MGSMPKIVESDVGSTSLAIESVADFLIEEGDVLRILLDLFEEIEAADKVFDLMELCREDCANVRGIMIALDIVLEALEQLSCSAVEDVARIGEGPRDLDAAIRWYGARVSDLLTRLRN